MTFWQFHSTVDMKSPYIIQVPSTICTIPTEGYNQDLFVISVICFGLILASFIVVLVVHDAIHCFSLYQSYISSSNKRLNSLKTGSVNNNTYECCIYMFERYIFRNTISGTTHRTSTFHMIGTHVIVVKLCSSQIFQIFRKCMFEFFQRPIEINYFICK